MGENRKNMLDLFLGKWFSTGDLVPFLQTAATARGRGMLGHKDRMTAHRRLSAVVFWLGWRQPFQNELPSMLQNRRQRFFRQIRPILHPQPKPATELALSQGGEEGVEILHHRNSMVGNSDADY